MPFAEAPGARLYCESNGSGTPIVFVHETCDDLRGWQAQRDDLSRTQRCIAYNARGYAPSHRGTRPETHDHRRLADDIGVVMDATGVESAFVVGLSMGAHVAAHFALAHVHRVIGLVLVGLGAGADDPPAFHARMREMAAAVRRDGMAPMVDQTSRAAHRVQLQRKDPAAFDALLARLRGFDAQGLADVLQHYHARRPSIYDSEAALRALQVPTLVVVGDEDSGCFEPALFLRRTLPRASLWVCPRTGHAVNLEEPAQFNAALRSFIDDVACGRGPAH
jgi:pimeloyl-ACP methyl ester carboxylesterase